MALRVIDKDTKPDLPRLRLLSRAFIDAAEFDEKFLTPHMHAYELQAKARLESRMKEEIIAAVTQVRDMLPALDIAPEVFKRVFDLLDMPYTTSISIADIWAGVALRSKGHSKAHDLLEMGCVINNYNLLPLIPTDHTGFQLLGAKHFAQLCPYSAPR